MKKFKWFTCALFLVSLLFSTTPVGAQDAEVGEQTEKKKKKVKGKKKPAGGVEPRHFIVVCPEPDISVFPVP